MVHLAHILIYPIKSLDGVAVSQVRVLNSGALAGDREFALVDEQGKWVNGKRTPAIHQIRATFDLNDRTVMLRKQGDPTGPTFHLDRDRPHIERWLSVDFGFPVHLIQNQERGFPDDTASPGPTIISTETLRTLTTWFPGLSLDNLRQRFRTNLELATPEAFWEDRLYGAKAPVPFQIGPVTLLGINPCQRCVVPTRAPNTGDTYPNFQKVLISNRQQSLPDWADASWFNHFYRLGVNTRLATSATQPNPEPTVQVGDPVFLACD